MKNFGIKDGYIIRTELHPFDDTPFKDEFQDEVYQLAAVHAKQVQAEYVVDLGCGSGFKLLKYFRAKNTIGIDRAPTVEWLNRTYPDRIWVTQGEPVEHHRPYHTLLICSDVIEHIENPDSLLDEILRIRPLRAVISTPDRVAIALGTEDGPPRNCHHIREWTYDEFITYLSERFDVVESIRGKTIVAVVKPK